MPNPAGVCPHTRKGKAGIGGGSDEKEADLKSSTHCIVDIRHSADHTAGHEGQDVTIQVRSLAYVVADQHIISVGIHICELDAGNWLLTSHGRPENRTNHKVIGDCDLSELQQLEVELPGLVED